MLRKIHKAQNPKFLVITPLADDEKLSMITLQSLFNETKTSFDWILADLTETKLEGVIIALHEYLDEFAPLPAFIQVDNDVEIFDNVLDTMYETLMTEKDNKSSNIGYCFSDFCYVNDNREEIVSFDNLEKIDISYLLTTGNYISTNSMISLEKFSKIDAEFLGEPYSNLNDYVLWLKFLDFLYIGKHVKGRIALKMESCKNALENDEYLSQLSYVIKHWIIPLRKKFLLDDDFKSLSTVMKASLSNDIKV